MIVKILGKMKCLPALLTVLCLLTTTVSAAGVQTVTSTKDALLFIKTNALAPEDVVKAPAKNISREELAVMAVRYYEKIGGPAVQASDTFGDLAGNPYRKEILAACKLNIMGSTAKGKFSPKAGITREQMAAMLYRIVQVVYPNEKHEAEDDTRFKDDKLITPGARKAVVYCYKSGIMETDAAQAFNPRKAVTREQAMVFLYKLASFNETVLTPSDRIQPEDDTEVLNGKTRKDIRELWKRYKPLYYGNPYKAAPSIVYPYKAGKVAPQLLADGFKMLNFIRYLSDLPYDLTEDVEFTEKAQCAAVLLAAGEFKRDQPIPKGMDEAFYNTANNAIGAAFRRESSFVSEQQLKKLKQDLSAFPHFSIADTVKNKMFGNSGCTDMFLHPQLSTIGFGYILNVSSGRLRWYINMDVDYDYAKPVEYDYVAWPGKGHYPAEFFNDSGEDGLSIIDFSGSPQIHPWYVQVNSEKFKSPEEDKVKVLLKRKPDNKTWVLDKADKNSLYYSGKEYFNIRSNRIEFRPNSIHKYKNNEEYTVTITGLENQDGEAASITYTVRFFKLQPAVGK